MEILNFKSWKEAKLYFISEVLPKMENEDGLPVDTLFSLWAENPMDYTPDTAIEVEEANELLESDNYDASNCHQQ